MVGWKQPAVTVAGMGANSSHLKPQAESRESGPGMAQVF